MRAMRGTAALSLLLAAGGLTAQSRWVHMGANGRLVYARTPQGDHMIDFSYAGYRGGGLALPVVKAERTVAPTGTFSASSNAGSTQTVPGAGIEVVAVPG